ncbi:MAG TPA: hypothetical protein VFW40_05785 [Capsulimonadaceae bacterium]|nr:hypothetical protein [Capsulimonadaceae bacterium]
MDRPEQETEGLDELESLKNIAFENWLQFRRDPECLIDPQKRSAMLRARLDYLDALARYIFVFRAGQEDRIAGE